MKKLIKNKKGLEFKSLFFSIVALSVVIIAVGVWVDDWNTIYDSGLSAGDVDTFGEYDYLDKMSGEASRTEGNISVKSSTQGEDFEGTTLRAVYGFLNNVFKPIRVIFGNNGMIDSVTDRFGIPDYWRQAGVTFIVFAIFFSLIAVLFRLTRSSA